MNKMKKIIEKIKEPSWMNDLISLGKDVYLFVRDTINNGTHLVVRFLKLVTAVSLWQKDLSNLIEELLHTLRSKLNMKK